jgi:AbrB family looped-hinge helix DNA binding protein
LGVIFSGKVQKLGRIAIPKDLRKALAIREGDSLEVEVRQVIRRNGVLLLDEKLTKELDDIRVELGRLGIHFASRNHTATDLRNYGITVDKLAELISATRNKSGLKHVS